MMSLAYNEEVVFFNFDYSILVNEILLPTLKFDVEGPLEIISLTVIMSTF